MGSITDYLTCGQCLKEFPLQKITLFIQHKKLDCDDELEDKIEDPELQCNYCPQGFMTAWGLLIHAQISHNLKIFLERASKSLLKDNRLYPVKPDLSNTALTFPNTEDILPLKAITGPTDNHGSLVSEAPALETAILSSSSLLPLPPISILKNTSSLIASKSTSSLPCVYGTTQSARFGSNIVVTRDISSGNMITSVPNLNQPVNISTVKFISDPSDNGSMKVSPVKLVTDVSSTSSIVSNSLTTVTAPRNRNVEVFQEMTPEMNDNIDRGKTETVEAKAGVKPKEGNGAEKNQDENNGGLTLAQRLLTSGQSQTNLDSCQGNTECGEKCAEDETSMDEGSECCDIQGCGVTVIPVTHQDLQKCCNAVVPKKRKRHMEMKHMPFSWSSSRYARRRMFRTLSNLKQMSSANLAKQAASSIFIEVESEPHDKQTSSNNNSISIENQITEDAEMSVDNSTSTVSQAKVSELQVQTLSSAEMKPRSLILKPGAIFSIPFTYTIPISSSMSTIQINPSDTMATRAQGSPVLAATLSQKGVVENSSQNDEEENSAQSQSTRKRQKSNKMLEISHKKHVSSKPFHCEICPMAFNQRIHLKKHIMSKHTGNKPFKCGECDYSTVERSHLKVHIRIHTGEKPFKCTYCEYATAQNSTLKIHLKRHHGGKMFHCTSCEKEFTQERQLKGHECEHVGVISPERKATSLTATTTSVEAESTEAIPNTSLDAVQGDNSTCTEGQPVGQITSLMTNSTSQRPGNEDVPRNIQNSSPDKS